MNGLLNNYQPDPIAQSLLGFAGGLLTPVSRGGGFGAGLLGASQGMSQARQEAMQIEQMKRQMAQDELRKRLIEAQVKETENQAAERMLKVEQDKRKQEATARFQSMLTGQDAQIPQGFDMRSASPQQSNFPQAQLNNPAMVMAALNAGMTPEQIKLLAESGNLGRAKVARTVETTDSQGRPTTVMVDDYGTTVGGAMPKAYESKHVTQGDRQTFYDPYTNKPLSSLQIFQSPDSKASNAVTMRGQDLVNARAREANALKSDEIRVTGGQKAFENENKLRDEYLKESKNFLGVRDAHSRVLASAENPSAAGDLALIYSFMRSLDPTSTVREGEFATAQNAGGVDERVRSMYNKVINGQRLSDNIRKDFVSRSQALYDKALESQSQLTGKYNKLASDYGLRSTNVTPDLSLRQFRVLPEPAAADGEFRVRR